MTAFATGIAIGFCLLLAGGEGLVRGSVGLARHLRISPLVVGLVLVGFGTSTPELATSMTAALAGSPGLAIGNVVGSNIANVLLILGLTALIYPVACDPRAFRRDAPMLIVATLLCVAVAFSGTFGRLAGASFLAALLGYTVYVYRAERRQPDASAALHSEEATLADPAPQSPWLAGLFAAGGIGLIVLGADLMVDGAVGIARVLGIPETVIGLTLLAVGTSLPELATSVVAALRRQTDIAFGNIVGSCLFNILGILGATALVSPIPVPPNVLNYDLAVLVATTGLLVLFAMTDRTITRREGLFFFAAYGGYMGLLTLRATGLA